MTGCSATKAEQALPQLVDSACAFVIAGPPRWYDLSMACSRRLPALVLVTSLMGLSCAASENSSDQGETGSGEASSTTQTSPETSEAESEPSTAEAGTGEEGTGETGTTGPECEPTYNSQTSFGIDLGDWPDPLEPWTPVTLDCMTTFSQLQGLGMVFFFECGTSGGGLGEVQITFGPLGAIEPPMEAGSAVQIQLQGGNFGGLSTDEPTPFGLNFLAQEVAISDSEGLLVGAAKSIEISDWYAPLGLSLSSPCGDPTVEYDFNSVIDLVESGQGAGTPVEVRPGESGFLTTQAGTEYRLDVGKVIRHGCCEVEWSTEFIVSRV